MTETAPGGPAQSTAQTEDALLTALADIRAHWPALLHAGGSSSIAGGNVGRSNDEVTALDRRVSLSHEVTLCLNGWACVIVEDRQLSHGLPLGTDTLGLVTLLERHARWFSGHEAVRDAVEEITRYAAEVQAAAAPKAREWIYLGDCPFVVEDWFCSGRVRSPTVKPDEGICSDCGAIGPVDWWEDVITGRCSSSVTRDDLPAFIFNAFGRHVARPTLHRWIKAGELERIGDDEPERFNRAQVIDAVTQRWVAS